MKIQISHYNATLTISNAVLKTIESYKISLLLAMSRKNRLLFLSGLAQLMMNIVSQILSIIKRVTVPTVSTILTIIASTIVKTGPPAVVVSA